MYRLAESHIMPDTNRLLVVIHHENIHELASLRFLKLNLECQNIKMEKHKQLYFFFHETLFEISIMQLDTTVVSLASVFFKKAAIIIATHVQKTLD